ncbi:NRDE family protein [Proteinivorax tanatarense]|uniref:NRDE family protein n=1 Tax=Proteinivorax tanatarense TaxID=1260629 RepID=A0AAU7VME9_9FIRM
MILKKQSNDITHWPKDVKAKNRLSFLLKLGFSVPQIFEILDDTEIAPDENLPDTGLTLDKERMLSPIHIDTPNYGTRIKTVILINKSGNVNFYEKGLNDNGSWELNKFKFSITKAHTFKSIIVYKTAKKSWPKVASSFVTFILMYPVF